MADQDIGPDRGQALGVDRAAPIEISILLDQLIGITLPIGPLGGDHVEMGDQQQRLQRVCTARQHRDQPTFLGKRGIGEQRQLVRPEAGRLEPGCHPFGRNRAAAGGDGSVDLHEFLEQAAELCVSRRKRGRLGQRRG